MHLDELPSLAGCAAALRRPETLAERGVVPPFLTPVLAGARLRLAREKQGFEVLLPHPAGREGCYVIPWSAALQECRPAYADRLLVVRLQGGALGPRPLWLAARRVAAEGLLGRAARLAAVTAEALEATRCAELACLLAARALELEPAAQALAPGLLACGTVESPGGHCVSAASRVARLARDLGRWAVEEAPTEEDKARAAALAAAAERAAAAALCLTAEAQALTADPARLLREPSLAAEAVRAGERPGWALDGFGFLAALWAAAGPPDRTGVVRLGARLVPPPSADMLAWPGFAGWEALPPCQAPRLPTELLEGALAGWLVP